jgi:hypothetical protein
MNLNFADIILYYKYTSRQDSTTGRYRGYKYKQRAYNHIPAQTSDEARGENVVGTKN